MAGRDVAEHLGCFRAGHLDRNVASAHPIGPWGGAPDQETSSPYCWRKASAADGFSALKSPLAEKYADAAEALERLAADKGKAEVASVNTDRPQNAECGGK